VEITEEEYDSLINNMELIFLEPIDIVEFSVDLKISPDKMEAVAAALSEISFMGEGTSGKISGDNDWAFSTVLAVGDVNGGTVSSFEGPMGIDISFKGGAESWDSTMGVWQNCGVLLVSEGDEIEFRICSVDSYTATLRTMTGEEDTGTSAALSDGEYQVYMYSDDIHEIDGVTSAYVDILSPVGLDDETVQNLALGDTIDLQPQGCSVIYVETIDKTSSDFGRDMWINDDEHFFWSDTYNLWCYTGDFDDMFTYISGSATLKFATDAVITEEMTYGLWGEGEQRKTLSGVAEYFSVMSEKFGIDYNTETVNITVKSGEITEATIYYHQ
jgi:hypothetical protein